MTQEEKAKAYDEAIERAKEIMECSKNSDSKEVRMVLSFFPELKESEDEVTRKKIINYFRCQSEEEPTRKGIYNKWIAWLEKQSTPAKLSEEEQNRFAKGVLTSCALSFINYLDAHKYEGKMCVSNGECEDVENAFHNAMWDKLHRYYCKYIEKQGEQKPYNGVKDLDMAISAAQARFEQKPAKWSEKDSVRLQRIVDFLWYNRKGDTDTIYQQEQDVEWLKSLKPQNKWKPSEEQMEALNDVISSRDIKYDVLSELWNDLRNLKENKL